MKENTVKEEPDFIPQKNEEDQDLRKDVETSSASTPKDQKSEESEDCLISEMDYPTLKSLYKGSLYLRIISTALILYLLAFFFADSIKVPLFMTYVFTPLLILMNFNRTTRTLKLFWCVFLVYQIFVPIIVFCVSLFEGKSFFPALGIAVGIFSTLCAIGAVCFSLLERKGLFSIHNYTHRQIVYAYRKRENVEFFTESDLPHAIRLHPRFIKITVILFHLNFLLLPLALLIIGLIKK